MHDLEELIAAWRKAFAAGPDVSAETLDELESHLRESTDRLVRSGMTVPRAFRAALEQLGAAPALASEFGKLDPPLWLPAKLAIGGVVALAVALSAFLFNRLTAGPSGLLLAGHVVSVTLGYTITLLLGGLGICFVCQRSVSDLSPSRLRSLARVSFTLGGVALVMTAIGVILGMFWARAEWGRYWAWDLLEIGGLSVLVWQAMFLMAHRVAGGNARIILAMGLLGNMVVSAAWLGPRLPGGLQAYGTAYHSALLLAAIVSHLCFFLISFAPAGWVRLRRA